jgi:hypothetical protein
MEKPTLLMCTSSLTSQKIEKPAHTDGSVSLLLAGDYAMEVAVRPDFVFGSMHPKMDLEFPKIGGV